LNQLYLEFSQDPGNDLIPTELDSVLFINLIDMQIFVTGIISIAFKVTVVEHDETFGIPLIVLISGIAKSSMQLTDLKDGINNCNLFLLKNY
jgi:hypothetical protein